jgi:hypothetical protein
MYSSLSEKSLPDSLKQVLLDNVNQLAATIHERYDASFGSREGANRNSDQPLPSTVDQFKALRSDTPTIVSCPKSKLF